MNCRVYNEYHCKPNLIFNTKGYLKSAKNYLFLRGNFRPLPNKNVQIWDHFFPLLFPKNSESLNILDIQLREVGAKRRLNGTSKSEQTDTRTDTRTFRLIESIGPEGRCFEKASRQKVFCMISSAPKLKHIFTKTQYFDQRQIIQPVPVVSDSLGHFVPFYWWGW